MDIRAVIMSQYLAALEMLKQAILACPPTVWNRATDQTPFWRVAYHALFYTHLYLQESEQHFMHWPGHQEAYLNDDTGSSVPASQELVLGYLEFCRQQVLAQTATIVLEGESGFFWLKFSKLELQLYSIRHIQQHVGELMERLGSQASQLDWIGSSAVAA